MANSVMNEGEPRPGGGIRRWAKAVVTLPGMSALIMLIIIAVGFQIWTEIFLNPRNLNLILGIVPELGVVVLGVTFLMIAREFDLSVGSVFLRRTDDDPHPDDIGGDRSVAGHCSGPGFRGDDWVRQWIRHR